MLAIVKDAPERGAVVIKEVPKPTAKPGEVLIRVKAAGVCGSDLHVYNYGPDYHFVPIPLILGHELAGEVAAVGEGVTGFEPGDRVTPESIRYCGQCRNCQDGMTNLCESFGCYGIHFDGGFAEYVAVRADMVHKLPEAMRYEDAALVEPTAVAVHAVLDRSEIRPGDTVVIFGAGAIGLLAAQVARAQGARVIVAGVEADAPQRLPLAERLGFETVNQEREDLSAALLRLTGRPLAATALECSGSKHAVRKAVEIVEKGGAVTLVGMVPVPVEFPMSFMIRRGLTIRCSYSGTHDSYRRAIAMIHSGAIALDPLVVRFAFTDAEAAFQAGLSKEVMKPVLMLEGGEAVG